MPPSRRQRGRLGWRMCATSGGDRSGRARAASPRRRLWGVCSCSCRRRRRAGSRWGNGHARGSCQLDALGVVVAVVVVPRTVVLCRAVLCCGVALSNQFCRGVFYGFAFCRSLRIRFPTFFGAIPAKGLAGSLLSHPSTRRPHPPAARAGGGHSARPPEPATGFCGPRVLAARERGSLLPLID